MKKGTLLITLSIIFLGVLAYNYVTDYSSLTTDSGFDSSYDGGSSFDSDSFDFDYDYDSGYSSSSSGSSSSSSLISVIIVIATVITIINLITSMKHSIGRGTGNKRLIISSGFFLIIGFLIIGPYLTILIFLFGLPFILSKKPSNTMPTDLGEDSEIVKECYQVFCDVQTAWMNFDYDKMRDLVTDELFNQYQNQLKQLELKGEKNIMEEFEYVSAQVLSHNTENEVEKIEMEMSVAFYDYIVDGKNKIVRGNKSRKLIMTYNLTYLRSVKQLTNCPNCNAELSEGQTVCEYCHTHIQSVTSKLKLASKKALRQQ